MPEADLEAIRYALELARLHGFDSVELRFGDTEFEAQLGKNGAAPRPLADAVQEGIQPPQDEPLDDTFILSPCVGFFQEGKEPLAVGRAVRPGEIVASISALGLLNDVECAIGGTVAEVMAHTGQPVEYGQPLARVEVEA